MEDYTYEYDYSNYTYDNVTPPEDLDFKTHKTCFTEVSCTSLLVVNVVIFLLGVCGNGVVIWIAGLKMKKTVNTTWYLSLAVSDFIFCACLPFNIINTVTKDWIFGLFMCKFTSFVMFLNMFCSIFLLVVISVDRCVSVMFPVWAQNHRTMGKASVVVVLAWVASVALSIPSIVFRDVKTHLGMRKCFNNYRDQHSHKMIAVSRFIGGFVLPFFIIIFCYSVIILRLRTNRMMSKSSKPFKVMTALIATFFICWLPYHVFVLLELNHQSYDLEVIRAGLMVGTTVAIANSFLNPMLYVFMGNDFLQKFKSSILSKMANAIGEEGRTTSRYLSRSSSMEGSRRTSTHI
ncbi:chemokine-like receptor 1 [Oncorhynchus tshawytscha]|uniref:G-protein coupled receptors family 1 profile domain-containing protein n=1 Tax=Oncorhynchus tshawytscha TaxID=74940 RepID=A0A8C8MAQ3_ONCTS|nr:chemokine-like receptor 1 [Oncorhynchus tshawytscha]